MPDNSNFSSLETPTQNQDIGLTAESKEPTRSCLSGNRDFSSSKPPIHNQEIGLTAEFKEPSRRCLTDNSDFSSLKTPTHNQDIFVREIPMEPTKSGSTENIIENISSDTSTMELDQDHDHNHEEEEEGSYQGGLVAASPIPSGVSLGQWPEESAALGKDLLAKTRLSGQMDKATTCSKHSQIEFRDDIQSFLNQHKADISAHWIILS
ncbi:hypothetical protein EGW08_020856 [Elysia chlorotica]|uniref:Uncharacterized protein n=1 Tax=Elysia chlorotica TaxID=188477 RepID=A0A3S1B3Z7_ELYCH|nr:hypothetical protein EGW08_020856 [Elysia chlorotica]